MIGAALALASGAALARRPEPAATEAVLEIATYELEADKVPLEGNYSALVQDFVSAQPGFIRRDVYFDRARTGVFTDIVRWESLDDAVAAAEKIRDDPAVAPFMAAIKDVLSFGHYSAFQ